MLAAGMIRKLRLDHLLSSSVPVSLAVLDFRHMPNNNQMGLNWFGLWRPNPFATIINIAICMGLDEIAKKLINQ